MPHKTIHQLIEEDAERLKEPKKADKSIKHKRFVRDPPGSSGHASSSSMSNPEHKNNTKKGRKAWKEVVRLLKPPEGQHTSKESSRIQLNSPHTPSVRKGWKEVVALLQPKGGKASKPILSRKDSSESKCKDSSVSFGPNIHTSSNPGSSASHRLSSADSGEWKIKSATTSLNRILATRFSASTEAEITNMFAIVNAGRAQEKREAIEDELLSIQDRVNEALDHCGIGSTEEESAKNELTRAILEHRSLPVISTQPEEKNALMLRIGDLVCQYEAQHKVLEDVLDWLSHAEIHDTPIEAEFREGIPGVLTNSINAIQDVCINVAGIKDHMQEIWDKLMDRASDRQDEPAMIFHTLRGVQEPAMVKLIGDLPNAIAHENVKDSLTEVTGMLSRGAEMTKSNTSKAVFRNALREWNFVLKVLNHRFTESSERASKIVKLELDANTMENSKTRMENDISNKDREINTLDVTVLKLTAELERKEAEIRWLKADKARGNRVSIRTTEDDSYFSSDGTVPSSQNMSRRGSKGTRQRYKGHEKPNSGKELSMVTEQLLLNKGPSKESSPILRKLGDKRQHSNPETDGPRGYSSMDTSSLDGEKREKRGKALFVSKPSRETTSRSSQSSTQRRKSRPISLKSKKSSTVDSSSFTESMPSFDDIGTLSESPSPSGMAVAKPKSRRSSIQQGRRHSSSVGLLARRRSKFKIGMRNLDDLREPTFPEVYYSDKGTSPVDFHDRSPISPTTSIGRSTGMSISPMQSIKTATGSPFTLPDYFESQPDFRFGEVNQDILSEFVTLKSSVDTINKEVEELTSSLKSKCVQVVELEKVIAMDKKIAQIKSGTYGKELIIQKKKKKKKLGFSLSLLEESDTEVLADLMNKEEDSVAQSLVEEVEEKAPSASVHQRAKFAELSNTITSKAFEWTEEELDDLIPLDIADIMDIEDIDDSQDMGDEDTFDTLGGSVPSKSYKPAVRKGDIIIKQKKQKTARNALEKRMQRIKFELQSKSKLLEYQEKEIEHMRDYIQIQEGGETKDEDNLKLLLERVTKVHEQEILFVKSQLQVLKEQFEKDLHAIEVVRLDQAASFQRQGCHLMKALNDFKASTVNLLQRENLAIDAKNIDNLPDLTTDSSSRNRHLLNQMSGYGVKMLEMMQTTLSNSFHTLSKRVKTTPAKQEELKDYQVANIGGVRSARVSMSAKLKGVRASLAQSELNISELRKGQEKRFEKLTTENEVLLRDYNKQQRQMVSIKMDIAASLETKDKAIEKMAQEQGKLTQLIDEQTTELNCLKHYHKQSQLDTEHHYQLNINDQRANLVMLDEALNDGLITKQMHKMTVGVIKQYKMLPLIRFRVLVDRYVAFRRLEDAKALLEKECSTNSHHRAHLLEYLSVINKQLTLSSAEWDCKHQKLHNQRKQLFTNMSVLFEDMVSTVAYMQNKRHSSASSRVKHYVTKPVPDSGRRSKGKQRVAHIILPSAHRQHPNYAEGVTTQLEVRLKSAPAQTRPKSDNSRVIFRAPVIQQTSPRGVAEIEKPGWDLMALCNLHYRQVAYVPKSFSANITRNTYNDESKPFRKEIQRAAMHMAPVRGCDYNEGVVESLEEVVSDSTPSSGIHYKRH